VQDGTDIEETVDSYLQKKLREISSEQKKDQQEKKPMQKERDEEKMDNVKVRRRLRFGRKKPLPQQQPSSLPSEETDNKDIPTFPHTGSPSAEPIGERSTSPSESQPSSFYFRNKKKHQSDSNSSPPLVQKSQQPSVTSQTSEHTAESAENIKELDRYSVYEPYASVTIVKDVTSLDKYYHVAQPVFSEEEAKIFHFMKETIVQSLAIRLDEADPEQVSSYLDERVTTITQDYRLHVSNEFREKIMYYLRREFIGFGKIDPLMRDPNIEDISCNGAKIPLFLYHRHYGSLQSNIAFDEKEELADFVVQLAQKCGKHITIAEPMLDATMPDGSRIQMTLGDEVTARGSTFTIRKFRLDPITPTDLIQFNSMSRELVAFMWMAVEHGVNALIAGGTAAGKTSVLNALSLFIPREAKIVSIEETREINLPHSNWIPGVVRLGFGEVLGDKLVGEIDLYDLMKAALRQRPEYIIVGEIRGKEAYVLFQAMATGHTTYSTVHADSAKSLIHRLEGKPINIPRNMLQSLDLIFLQTIARLGENKVRRCRQIVEIIDIDPQTNEVLTNEVFTWEPLEDKFVYSGKSYVLEKIRTMLGLNHDDMIKEIERRVEILQWMEINEIRAFKDFARIVAKYKETPDKLIEEIRHSGKTIDEEGPHPFRQHNEAKVEETTQALKMQKHESEKIVQEKES
jgi:flagellar protein FlaI